MSHLGLEPKKQQAAFWLEPKKQQAASTKRKKETDKKNVYASEIFLLANKFLMYLSDTVAVIPLFNVR